MKSDTNQPTDRRQPGKGLKAFLSKALSSKKLSTKLALIIGGALTLLFALLIVATTSMTGKEIEASVSAELSQTSTASANQVQNLFNIATSAATDMQDYLEKCYQRAEENPQDDQVPTVPEAAAMCESVVYDKTLTAINYDAEQFMSETARNTAVNNSEIYAMGVFFAPKKFQKDMKEYAFYVTEDNANSSIKAYDKPYSEYSQEEFYKLAADSKDVKITPPYSLNGQDSLSIGAPIVYKDEVQGVIRGDVNMNNFEKIRVKNDRYPSMYSTIYDQNGNIIFDTESEDDIGKNITEFTPKADELQTVQSKMAGGKAFNIETTREDGRKVIRYFTPIKAGADTWWSLTAIESSDANRAVLETEIMLIIFSVIGLAMIITVVVVILRRKLRPMENMAEAAKSIAEGTLDVDVTVESDDEIGIMAKAFMTMSKRLQEIIADVNYILSEMAAGNFNVQSKHKESYIGDYEMVLKAMQKINNNLSDTLARINTASDQVSAGSDQVSAGAQELSQGATEQASSVEELAATINEISSQIKITAENANDAKSTAVITAEELENCNGKMTDMTAAMGEINDSSAQIGKIIKTIEDIAFQTNILALNAAVEAARAGEAGKGFAVVADEVRNLASKSAEASKNTSALIENATHSVEKGIGIAEETAESLLKVVESAGVITDKVDDISDAAGEQADAIAQVSQGIDQISSVVQTNSATAEESAAASEELSSQAQLLKDLVEQFTLRK